MKKIKIMLIRWLLGGIYDDLLTVVQDRVDSLHYRRVNNTWEDGLDAEIDRAWGVLNKLQ